MKILGLNILTDNQLAKAKWNFYQNFKTLQSKKIKVRGGQYALTERQEQPLHCGYKSCQFSTHYPSKLKMHRTKVHKKNTTKA